MLFLSTRNQRLGALVPASLATLAIAAPYLLTHGWPAAAFVLERGFTLVCHQRPERSLIVFGAPVAICARCLGIYLGAAFGLLLRTSRHVAVRLLLLAAALNLLDGVTELAGLHGNWMFVRLALGLTLGASGALLVCSSASPILEPLAQGSLEKGRLQSRLHYRLESTN